VATAYQYMYIADCKPLLYIRDRVAGPHCSAFDDSSFVWLS